MNEKHLQANDPELEGRQRFMDGLLREWERGGNRRVDEDFVASVMARCNEAPSDLKKRKSETLESQIGEARTSMRLRSKKQDTLFRMRWMLAAAAMVFLMLGLMYQLHGPATPQKHAAAPSNHDEPALETLKPVRNLPAMARLDFVNGKITILRKGNRCKPTGRDIIYPGDTIIAAPIAFAQLSYMKEKTKVIVLADSEVVFDLKQNAKQIEIKRGGLHADVLPQKKPMVLHTPHGRVTVLGTRFNLRHNQQRTRVDMLHGEVNLRHAESKKERRIRTGMYGEIRNNEPIHTGELVLEVIKISLVEERHGLIGIYSDIQDGTVIHLSDLATRNVNFVVETSPPVIDRLQYDTSFKHGKEDFYPYTLAGDRYGNYQWLTLEHGVYTVYLKPIAKGIRSKELSIHFTVK